MDIPAFQQSKTRSDIVRNTGIAALVTTVLNLVVYFIADAAGWIPDNLTGNAANFGVVAIIISTIIPIVLGGVLLMLLISWTNHPVIMFSLIAAVAFIASLSAPLSIGEASTSFKSVLVLMHVITAGLGTAILLRGVDDEPED
jgi:peptidoglycan/LPS O-acetylase OafA/YrhL